MFQNKYLVIGGDMRNISLANHLAADSNVVEVFGFSQYDAYQSFKPVIAKNLQKAIKNAEVIVGPVPCCSEPNVLNTPYNKQPVAIDYIFEVMEQNQIFIAGRIPKDVLALAARKSIPVFDILERNEMAILNAIPTAEGAIQIALEQMKITLHDSNAMVLGFGRIGKILCKMLDGIGANVYGATRRFDDYASIVSYGYQGVMLNELTGFIGKMDLIVNTAPHILLDKSNLKFVRSDCLIIDLASAPYGVDFEECKKLGINALCPGSLPGKVAPETAAKYIKDTVYNILSERMI